MATEAVKLAAQYVSKASSLVCLTGAGVSAESGIPTFRDAQTGWWSRFDPEELASPQGFARNPGLVWRWYMWRLSLVEQARPNPGHLALAELEGRMNRFWLITQNVDDLHEQAGNHNVLRLHGRLNHFLCSRCQHIHELSRADRERKQPPPCRICTAPVRPDVVWFGESLPTAVLQDAVLAASRCDLMLVIGSSGLVHPAAGLPQLAKKAGATVINVNPQPGPFSHLADLHLQGRSGEILPRLMAALSQ